MSSPYHARPPLLMGSGSNTTLRKELRRVLVDFVRVLYRPLIPHNFRPEAPEDPPEPAKEVCEELLSECQSIFDSTDRTRERLETKARSTFGLVAFLVPLLASIVLFALGQSSGSSGMRTAVILISSVAAVLLMLSLISVIRAVAVQPHEVLFLDAIIDQKNKTLREYDRSFHARGLLYCASINAAMNSHVAEFVRSAHINAATAVIVFAGALVPASIVFLSAIQSVDGSQTVTPIPIESRQLAEVTEALNRLASAGQARSVGIEREIDTIKERVDEVESRLDRTVE